MAAITPVEKIPAPSPSMFDGGGAQTDGGVSSSHKSRRHGRFDKLQESLGLDRSQWTKAALLHKLFWAAIFITGAVLTIVMCLTLTNTYFDYPTTTILTLQRNETLHQPVPPTLCIYLGTWAQVPLWRWQLYDINITEADVDAFIARTLTDLTRLSFTGNDSAAAQAWPKFVLKAVDLYLMHTTGYNYDLGFFDYPLVQKLLDFIFVSFNVNATELEKRMRKELTTVQAPVENSQTQYTEAVAAYFSNPHITKETLLRRSDDESTWPPSFYYLTMLCLHMVMRAEVGVHGLWNTYPLTLDWYRTDADVRYNADRLGSCLAYESNVRRLNASMDEVRQKFGHETTLHFNLTFCAGRGGNCVAYPKREKLPILRTTCANAGEVCYHLSGALFTKLNQPTIFARQSSRMFPATSYRTRNSPALAMDFSGRERDVLVDVLGIHNGRTINIAQQQAIRPSARQQRLTSAWGQQTLFSIGIESLFRYLSVVKSVDRCYQGEKTVYTCFRECRAFGLMRNNLNCTPTTLVPLDDPGAIPGQPECSLAVLSVWPHNQTACDNEPLCMSDCLNACEDWRMTITKESNTSIEKQSVVLNFRASNFEYTLYEEDWLISLSTFMGNMGGVLGLWLGIDLLVAVQFLLTPISFGLFVFRRMKRMKTTTVGGPQQQNGNANISRPRSHISAFLDGDEGGEKISRQEAAAMRVEIEAEVEQRMFAMENRMRREFALKHAGGNLKNEDSLLKIQDLDHEGAAELPEKVHPRPNSVDVYNEK